MAPVGNENIDQTSKRTVELLKRKQETEANEEGLLQRRHLWKIDIIYKYKYIVFFLIHFPI